jgi:signal peptidase I
MSNSPSAFSESLKKKWVGSLLSLFVPGFGLVRAGKVYRGIAWFIQQIAIATFFVQRLVGLPGEKIEIRDGHVFADGQKLGEANGIPDIKYVAGPDVRFLDEASVYQVPKDCYFMLGDNSKDSFDSRYWGYLPRTNVYARVARIYYPFCRVGVPK